LVGCLSNSYNVPHDELARLSSLPPEDRWESIRATQRIGGEDNPPEPDWPSEPHPVYVTTVVVESHHHGGYYGGYAGRPPPARVSGRIEGPATARPAPSTTPSIGKGKGDPASAALVAAAVVVGAGTGIALAATEGARYDGWVAVHPDEPLHLRLSDGTMRYVPLSALSSADAAAAEEATIYEGSSERYPKLGRAPLNRQGFTLSTAFHMGSVPQIDRTNATGFGGALFLGGNIANTVTLGLGASIDSGFDSRHSVYAATIGPEIQIYPTKYLGAYGGVGWAFRNTTVGYETRADEGWLLRGGLVGEIPLTTRLAFQARAGATQPFFDEHPRLGWEGSIGLAIY
jgi:hypothetical protein